MSTSEFIPLTLVLIRRNGQLLLGLKKRGFGQGRWNGFGGKLNSDETVMQAAARELQEEVGLSCGKLTLVGRLEFYQPKPPHFLVYIFHGEEVTGEPQESEEMKPKWFDLDSIPLEQMWPDDKHWLPLFLDGKHFRGAVTFDSNDQIISHFIAEVSAGEKLND